MPGIYDFQVQDIDGKPASLADYKGKVLLVVNTASQCGYTPQYAGLQALYATYRDRGFEVLGFPCDQFGHQEPGSNHQVKAFCETKFAVRFPMFAKIEVNGSNAAPLFKHLKAGAPGLLGTQAIKWNFTKFLVDRGGKVVSRHGSTEKPETLVKRIERLLG